MRKFEEADSIRFFHKLTQRFVDRGFNNPWEPTINKILEILKTTLCNSKHVSMVWLPQDLKNKVLNHLVNCQMIRPTPKPRNMYDSWKKRWITNWGRKKNDIVYKNCGTIQMLTWIVDEVEHWICLLKKLNVDVETKSHKEYDK